MFIFFAERMQTGPEAFQTPAAKATGTEVFYKLFHDVPPDSHKISLVLPESYVLCRSENKYSESEEGLRKRGSAIWKSKRNIW